MAVSSTTTTAYCATICLLDPSHHDSSKMTWKSGAFPSNVVRFPLKSKARFLTQCSSPEVATQDTSAEVDDSSSSSSVESASKVPYSLISTLNVEKVLRGIAITDVDHYGRLGIQRGCPYDQVAVAYKNKCEEIMMNQELEEEEQSKKLELLKESYSILSSEEERRMYDWSLSRVEKLERYVWPFEADITQTPTQIPPPPEPEDVEPTRLVGYFMLSWVLLSFVLSVLLNR